MEQPEGDASIVSRSIILSHISLKYLNSSYHLCNWGEKLVAEEAREVSLYFFSEGAPFHLEILRSSRGFDRLLEGFERIRAVTYVAEARTVLDLFEKHGYGDVELVLGESFSEFQGSLDAGVLTRLCSHLEKNSLRLYAPRKTIHSKLYILERPGQVRILHGSRNLYPTGSWDSVAVYDLPTDHRLAKEFVAHYEEHREGCARYMGDLLDQLRKEPERRAELIEAYLQRGAPVEESGVHVIIREATLEALRHPSAELLTIEVPADPPAQREVEKLLEAIRPTRTAEGLTVRTHEYLGLVERKVGLPLMVGDVEGAQVRLVLGGQVRDRTKPLPEDPSLVYRALFHLERYIGTADSERATPWDLKVQKAAMFEAILYFLAAPFFHEHMKTRRAKVGLVDRRGPLFLLIYGRSSNGKSTFLQFALKLLAGASLTPLPGKEFKETTLERARSVGTTFPLAFDDMASVTDRKFEMIVKSYWEKQWDESEPVPTLVFSTNVPTLRDWARTRVEKVVFPVYFQPDPKKKEELHQLLLEENPLFEWFSHLYLTELQKDQPVASDDLAMARQVMRRLYEYAGRQIPSFFPQQPFETLFGSGRLDWHDLLYGIKKAQIVEEGSRLRIDFTKDMQAGEVSYYESLLPLNLNKDKKGNTLLIYSPEAFRSWLGDQVGTDSNRTPRTTGQEKKGLIERLKRRLRRPPSAAFSR